MPNYILLERIELNASAASVTFANIPQTGYTDLKIVLSTRDTSTGGFAYNIAFNGVTTSRTSRWIEGDGASAISYSTTNALGGYNTLSTQTANTFASSEIYIPNYAGSNNKSFSVESTQENNATTSYMVMGAGLWSSSAAITSVALSSNSGNFVANSTFSLYGLAALGTTPVIAPKASGGNVIATDGTYWYHAFLSSGTFTPSTGLSCDYLVVAGGAGGGGAFLGGGGGAGGVRAFTAASISTAQTVTVGGGGAGGTAATQTKGSNGSTTTFNSQSVSGGGGGGSYGTAVAGVAGGSGGGGSGDSASSGGAGNTGSYSPVEGFAGGGSPSSAPNYGAGAGGGASAVGNAGTGSGGGIGGAGTDIYNSINFSTWLTTTGMGSSTKVAGGGGGAAGGGAGTEGAGGVGGGGKGGNFGVDGQGVAGATNTGSGGGGSERGGGTNRPGGAGGSGLVIIRYTIA
jgi:hypothetical protein